MCLFGHKWRNNVCEKCGKIRNDAHKSDFVIEDGVLIKFKNKKNYSVIVIPNTVTSIGESAFRRCSRLTSITIPNSVTSIGDGAFSICNGLTSITIPNSITSIEDGAFSGCIGLTSVTIPNSVTSIGNGAFSSCRELVSITIPNSVRIIGKAAFFGCSGLTSITIPNSVTTIGVEAFSSCSELTSIELPENIDIGKDAFPINIAIIYRKGKNNSQEKNDTCTIEMFNVETDMVCKRCGKKILSRMKLGDELRKQGLNLNQQTGNITFSGIIGGSADMSKLQRFAQQIEQRSALKCNDCGSIYCLTCLANDAPPHPTSGGKACFHCGGTLTYA